MPIRTYCQAERYTKPDDPVYGLYAGADIEIVDPTLISLIHSKPNPQGSIIEHHMRYLCPECQVIEVAYLSDTSYALLSASGVTEEVIQVGADTLQHPDCEVRGPMAETDMINLLIDLSYLPSFYRSQEPGQH